MGAMACNYALFYLGIRHGIDLVALGAGLLTVNGPVIGYVINETVRPSGAISKGQEKS